MTDEREADAKTINREFQLRMAAVTGGLAPQEYAQAWWDWLLGLAQSPDMQGALLQRGMEKALDSWSYALQAGLGQAPPPAPMDSRFASEAWNAWPFNVYAHSYSNWQDWWQEALIPQPGTPPKSSQLMQFVGSQIANAASPANYLGSNPELLEQTRAEAGQNLVRGFNNYLEDLQRTVDKSPAPGTERFQVGRHVAATPGKVVLQTELMELIQYTPTTDKVHAEPILITPAWIMKYYVLDLSPKNSLVRYLVEQGHTVFMISWKNPQAADRNLGMDDYVRKGFMAALEAVNAIVPEQRVHALGYCIGGTLLLIAATALAQAGDQRLATVTLLAAQSDFSEPGELSLFISPSQIEMLEALMHRAGVLDSRNMGGAFALLRSQDLLWTPAINSYVRGRRDQPNDLMAWNADGTRMPWRMHTDYLTQLYLNNELAQGEYEYAGSKLVFALCQLRLPIFVLGTETDHVAPWRSVYKARGLTRSNDYTFLLTSGGHNAGIVTGASHPRRRYRVRSWQDELSYMAPDDWLRDTPVQQGAWWPVWQQWLSKHSSPELVDPPHIGNAERGYAARGDAPGEYVLQR
ncbi:MAG TPA: alpha/beta fold hydrolase [Steroidobacteraceae bacterium]|nr:alpha/beta fold hydrolase [Steroidobacteraceae bacterium]